MKPSLRVVGYLSRVSCKFFSRMIAFENGDHLEGG